MTSRNCIYIHVRSKKLTDLFLGVANYCHWVLHYNSLCADVRFSKLGTRILWEYYESSTTIKKGWGRLKMAAGT